MALTVFLVAATFAVLLIGVGFFWVAYHAVCVISDVRQGLLPQVDLTLTEVQKNLNRIDELAKEVDTTVGEANQLVHSANRTVQSVEDGLHSFNQKVAIPVMIAGSSIREGVVAALRAYREHRAAKKRARTIVLPETVKGHAERVEVLQP